MKAIEVAQKIVGRKAGEVGSVQVGRDRTGRDRAIVEFAGGGKPAIITNAEQVDQLRAGVQQDRDDYHAAAATAAAAIEAPAPRRKRRRKG